AILSNQGAIDALFHQMWPSTVLGACFAFQPREGIIEPGGHQAIHISFSSTVLGPFSEEFKFHVNGSPQPVTLVIRGCVIGPTFHFSVPSLDFGDVSFGFPQTLSCCLSNTSLVPMTFSLHVPGDGNGDPSIRSQDQASGISRPVWRKAWFASAKPKEFTISPSYGTIRPQGFLDIEVTLCSNTVKTYETALVVDIKGSGEDVLALPISARCLTPPLNVASTTVNFGRCFLKFQYQQVAKLVNEADLPGCYGVLPQEYKNSPNILYSSPAPCGIIPPHATVEIPLALEVKEKGHQETMAYIAIFGNEDFPLKIQLVTFGEGPVVYVHPSKIDFGCIQVLKNVSRALHLSNQSVIPAPFKAQMARTPSQWRIDPSEGVVPPEAEISLTLTVNLDDTILFQDKINMAIENSNSYIIPVQATGIGTTIVTDKPFAPAINLGPHFSLDPCCYRFKITNCGRRTHQLYWMTEGFAPFRQHNTLPAISASPKSPTIPTKTESQGPVFKLQPLRMELAPGQSMDMVLEGSSDIPKLVKERLLCHAIIGKQSGKERIMKVDVTCEFITPVLQISSRAVTFRVEKNPSDILTPQYKPLSLKNVSSLPLRVVLSLQEPFALCDANHKKIPVPGQPLKMDIGEIHHLSVRFNPVYRDDLCSRVSEEVLILRYLEHPHVDYVDLRGEVHFPNLHFQTMDLNFGCILNDTEVIRDISMSNCSPLLIRYRWSFLTDDRESFIRFSSENIWPLHAQKRTEEQEILKPPQSPPRCKFHKDSIRKTAVEENTSYASGEEISVKELDDVQIMPEIQLFLQTSEVDQEAPENNQAGTKDVLWCAESEEPHLTGVEEVFDILPLYGTLQPNETQQMSFTFYGHANIVAYPLDHICMAEIILRNKGKVGFEYSVLDAIQASADNPPPGVPLTLPVTNYIDSGKEQILKVYYLPGVPEVFQRTFQIQVAHLEPDSITLKGQGIFPRICLDLPRNIRGNERYSSILKEVKQRLEQETQKEFSSNSEALTTEPPMEESFTMLDTQLQMELERLLVQEHALEQQKLLASVSVDDPAACQRARRKLVKAQLPEYILDFGYIIMGTIRTHIIKLTNTGHFPVSFHADRRALRDTGFNTELDRVKNLPFCETETFEIWFDPQSASCALGEIEVLLPIKVVAGPTFHISLRATVIMPSLCMSSDNLEFSAVQCGQCQVETIQLHNQLQVVCEWFATSNEQMKKVDKHMPMTLRRKMREPKAKPHVFEMIPPYGILAPGERLNVQVKFAPREEKLYHNVLILSISQSTQQLLLNVSGQGLEPRLEFSPCLLELGPLLPYGIGDEAEVVVKNPCSFPIEFYSLELDQQYLLEERILRMLKGYDNHRILLLPPRMPGEKLPIEVLEYFEEQKKIQGDQEGLNLDNEEEESTHYSEHGMKPHPSVMQAAVTGGSALPSLSLMDNNRTLQAESKIDQEEEEEEEGTEKGQMQAIARHLGIDISPEGRAARNRRGIAIIIHGAPFTGKTSAAVLLAKHYSAACLSIDSVVLEAISDGSSSAGLRARELCIRAAIEQAQRENEDGGTEGQPALALGTRLSTEALAKHTSNGSQQSSESKTGPLSIVSRGYRGSTATAKGKLESHLPIPSAPLQRRLSVSASGVGDYGLMSCVLPDELLVEILSERMQLSDCYRGMVFDGLETMFARSMVSALLCLLKAINNRRYIYFVNLCQDFAAMKAREISKQEQEEREQQEAVAREKARLQEMDEEEYDALTEEQKIQFDNELLQALRERKRRELEKLARELEEKKHQQELERLREEEEVKKKSKRYKRDGGKEKEEGAGKKGQQGSKQNPNISAYKSDGKLNEGLERKGSIKERPDVSVNDKDEKKKKSRMALQNEQPGMAPSAAQEEEEAEKDMSENEKSLAQRFKLYEASQKEIAQILVFWDRVQLVQLQPPGSEDKQEEAEDQRQAPSGRKGRKDRERERQERLEKERAEKERLEKEKAERERLEKLKAMEDSRAAGLEGEGGGEGMERDLGIPSLEIHVLSSEESSGKRILESGKLPRVIQILNGLGLGPSGPPIPPTAFFSVIPYPEKRPAQVASESLKHFTFIIPEELNPEEDKKEGESGVETPASLPVAKSRKEKPEVSREAPKEKKGASRSRKGIHPSPGTMTTLSELDQSSPTTEASSEKLLRLNCFRWIVPANGEVSMRIHFSSTKTGLFDQVLNFEILGTRRQYQVCCRGTCTYPTICQDPTIVFPHRKKTIKPDEIVYKKYILSLGVFHFGPLLCGKSREKYKAARYPNHFEKLTILNISPLEVEVHFFFQQDSRAVTYLLDPPMLMLKPNQKQVLTVWAYPTAAGVFEDSIVCCVKENPEPVTFRICCQGVRPEVELDRRQLHFEKLLLHRKETKSLYLKNVTPLPVAWRISGLENIGDDFCLSEDIGIIEPFTEHCLLVSFKATKALNLKKAIRLEVSDAENILGIVQIENIQIVAEAYDVALDISFPKGTNGGLEFGVVRVMDEAKQMLSMKNKGKYEIAFSLVIESTEYGKSNLGQLFTIQPQKGNLSPNDRPTQVQIVFHSKKEVKIEDKPVLQCHVIEPSLCEGGETIATIPIRLSVLSLFSKYNIVPPSVINFGPIMNGTRKTSSFTIENKGVLDFKFTTCKQVRDVVITARKGNSNIKSSRSRDTDLSRQNAFMSTGRQSKHADSLQKDMNLIGQARFSLGMFTVSPGYGNIAAGGHQVITVDCFAEPAGKCEEYLIIEITDRDPEDSPGGILYTLVAESCIPGFLTDNPGIIYEEHRICNSGNLSQVLKTVGCEGVFVTDENKFLFNNVLVGHQAAARFKICNPGRIPCDVVMTTKPISAKSTARISDTFELHPVRMSIASHSHAFATLTFSPQAMQNYQCIFEASVDAMPSVVARSRALSFEVSYTEALPLVLKNSGSLLVQSGAFTLRPRPTTQCIYLSSQNEESEPSDGARKPHTASLVLHNGEAAELDVIFQPSLVQRVEGLIHLSIVDNQYEETSIQMVGEGYQDNVTLDNVHSPVADAEDIEGQLDENTGEAVRTDYIQFGDCHIGKLYQAAFSITNHSKLDVMRFEWPAVGPCQFSPQVGHLHAKCTKNITLALKSSLPITLREQLLRCKVSRIAFQCPADQVPDWDDRLHTVKWVDVSKGVTSIRPAKKKVIETDPEPAHMTVEESSQDLALRVSANIDFAQYKMDEDVVHFRDTLLFQTRVFTVELSNTGNVQLEYSWKVVMEEGGKAVNFATEPLPTSPEGNPSRASTVSIKVQPSRPSSQLGSLLESFSSYVFPVVTCPPFFMEPSSGKIPPGKSQMPNLKLDEEGPVVAVKGKSLLPYCHFELEDSDYITANRRNSDLRGPGGMSLDPQTKVIEFTSVGVHVKNSRSFAILNPTNATYSFQWRCEQQEERKTPPAFICFTERGLLRPEKKIEIIFEFIPKHLDVTESFWTFTISEHNITVPFLLVGHTTDPAVSFEKVHLNLHLLLIGHEARECIHIHNDENKAYTFAFRDSSRFSEGRINCLSVQPMEGLVLPHSRFPIHIHFTPTQEGEVNFNLLCDVKKKSQPLCLNVKATGHTMNVSVKCEEHHGVVTELKPELPKQIHFREMQVNDYAKCNFSILNTGKFNFTFSWEFCNGKKFRQYFALSPESGTVEAGERVEARLSFHPLKAFSLKDMELKLQISHGPTFTCVLQGSVLAPSIHFSALRVDFGNCFIYQAGMPISKRILVITNKDSRKASVECLFINTAYLEVSFHSEALNPGEKVEIPISFYPREAISYHEVVAFEINGILQRTVEIFGKGIEMKIDVVEPPQKVLKFGAIPPGHIVKKGVTLVNNSVTFVVFSLSFVASIPELQEAKVLTMSPSGEITLKPQGGTCHVEVTFSPKSRILPFSEEVLLECQGVLNSLFIVQGCCQGIEVHLDQDHIPFGAVVLRSQASRRIVMQNSGDLGVGPDFSIKPIEGYISPGTSVPFEVTFHPCEQSQDICYENLPCHIQGGEPVRLTLSGMCVSVPPVKEVVNFICQVRGKQTQTIMLSNKTNQPWMLRPIIEGEQWKGPEYVRVEAHQQNKPYEVTYRPLAMNVENKKDQGSVFFPLPDGTGLLYLLQGTAEPPKSAGNIMREIPCKTSYTELLPITNCTIFSGRFRVILDMIKPEKLEVTTTLKTLDYIEVPASTKKDHKLTFFSYKEGMYTAKVTFRNEATQEFLFYLITFKATPCGPLGTLELTTTVRQSTASSVKVENPLHYQVSFNTDCKVPDINLPPQFMGTLVFEFLPMRPGETSGRLALNSSDLGSFQYDLILKATPGRPEKPLCFSTMLGSSQSLVAKIVNYTRQKTEYSTKIDCPDFQAEKVISAPAGAQTGTEVGVEVTFEPCQLGEARGTLLLSSAAGGDYLIPLRGTALSPRPQGPVQIRLGASAVLPFKNVFLQPTAFSYAVDSAAFSVRAAETIRPKKTTTISVAFEGAGGGNKAPVTGKLVVSCPRAAGLGSPVSWVYYLRGVPPEK
ncbi:hypothetical protein E2320_000954, partial [Naja naja]